MRAGHVIGLLTVLAGCGASPTDPEAMSAEAHERAARAQEARASSADLREVDLVDGLVGYDIAAAVYHVHAEAHREAAKTLREGEQAACEGVDNEVRATCPLLAHVVEHIEHTERGVRVVYAGADADTLEHHVECHHAFGARVGRRGMPGCPLYSVALSVRVEPTEKGAVLVLESDTEDTVKRLHEIYAPR